MKKTPQERADAAKADSAYRFSRRWADALHEEEARQAKAQAIAISMAMKARRG